MIHAVLSALAEPTRLEAMRLPAGGSECRVCAPMRKPGASRSRMSRHMQVLKQVGLVVDRRDAQRVRRRVAPDLPPSLLRLVEAAFARPILAGEPAA